jgi:23S rRNA (uracil1939-C5)-methyltransferase
VTEHLVIDRIGHRGDGVVDSRADGSGEPIFILGALPGEMVEVESVPGHPDRRQLLRVEKPSPERIAPICPHFGVCGGCAMQHWQTSAYRAWKRGLLVEALRQAGIDAPIADLIDAHGDGRRRAVFHARRGTHDILEVGFSAARAHQVIPIDRCPILAKGLDGALKAAWAIAELLSPLRKPLDIHATETDAGLDIDVRGSGPLTAAATTALAGLVSQHNLARLTRHGELVAQARAPTLRVGPATVFLPPAAFLQATTEGETVLARLVSDICTAVKPKKGVADLFAGIGPFALRLAEQARVTACDDDEVALAALSRAANSPGLKPVTTERRDLFKNPCLATELDRFDAVVFDPPRQGAQAQSREIAASRVPIVAAVSCNPGTFARDARILLDGGYRMTGVTPVDQFRYSAHVELVARFEK